MIKQRGQSRKHNFSKGDLGSTPIKGKGGVGWGWVILVRGGVERHLKITLVLSTELIM